MISRAIEILLSVLPLFVAIVLHEISHGVAAYCLGDDTAKKAGRFKLHTHFDLYGSFLIPLGLYLANSPFMFGYAKPVPVDDRKFKDPLLDMAIVAIAGPLCNLILAVIFSRILLEMNISGSHISEIAKIILKFIAINIGLFLFNLIPIPPLDGSRIIAALLPRNMAAKFYCLEQFGIFIILGIELICKQISSLTGYNVGLVNMLEVPYRGMLNILLS